MISIPSAITVYVALLQHLRIDSMIQLISIPTVAHQNKQMGQIKSKRKIISVVRIYAHLQRIIIWPKEMVNYETLKEEDKQKFLVQPNI